MDPTTTPVRRYRIVCQETKGAVIQHGQSGNGPHGPWSVVDWHHGTRFTSEEAKTFCHRHTIRSQQFSITTRNPHEQTAQ